MSSGAKKLPLYSFTRHFDEPTAELETVHKRNKETTLHDKVYIRVVDGNTFRYVRRIYVNRGKVVKSKRMFSINMQGCCRRVFLEKHRDANWWQ